MNPDIIDRCRGSFIGLVIADALGQSVEFKPPGTFAPVADYRAGGPFNLKAGDWTDDSSMALALADSLAGSFSQEDQLTKYSQWWTNGKYSVNGRCFDIGNTTKASLTRYLSSKNVQKASDPHPSNSGNGSIMRLCPVPIKYHMLYPDNIKGLTDYAALSGATTHAAKSCQSACRYMALVIAALINGTSKEDVLSKEWVHYKTLVAKNELTPDVLAVTEGSFKVKQPPEIFSKGYVVATLEVALWAFYTTNSFEDAIKASIATGWDTDTNACVTGQIAGAYYGESKIPQRWKDGLSKKETVEEYLNKLLESIK